MTTQVNDNPDLVIQRLLQRPPAAYYSILFPQPKITGVTLVSTTHTSKADFNRSVYPMLTEGNKPLIDEVVRIVHRFAETKFGDIPSPVEVSGFSDPEEGVDYISVAVDVPLDAQEALTFWDELGEEVDKWIATLTPDKAQTVLSQINTRVRWK